MGEPVDQTGSAITGFQGLDLTGSKALDIGASTGGFTDVLLQWCRSCGAVDVGRGQLHERLAADDWVTVLDNTNARYLSASILPYMPDVSSVMRLLFLCKSCCQRRLGWQQPGLDWWR